MFGLEIIQMLLRPRKFWLEDVSERGEASPSAEPQRPSSLTLAPSPAREGHFSDAIETLQLLSTAFSPRDKLAVIQKTFECINEVCLFFHNYKREWLKY